MLWLLRCSLFPLKTTRPLFSAKYRLHAIIKISFQSDFTGGSVCFHCFSLNKKGCCSTRCENKCCTDIFKKKTLFMMLIYEKRKNEGESVLSLLLFNTVSDENGIILKCTIYRDVFHSWKSLYASLWSVTVLFTWYNITLCFCTVTDVRAISFFLFFSLYDKKKKFYFQYCFCILALSHPQKIRKEG